MENTSHVFGIYETQEHAGRAVDGFVRNGFDLRSITVLCGDSPTSRDFAADKHTRLPPLALDQHGDDVAPDGSWGLLDPQCGPQAGSIFSALVEMEISSEWAEGAVLEGKVLVSVDCVDPQGVRLGTELLNSTGALEVGFSPTRDAADTPEQVAKASADHIRSNRDAEGQSLWR